MPAKNQAAVKQTIPVSVTLQPNVKKTTPSATIPADVSTIAVTLDASWFTDPTALISWGVEVSTDGGATWLSDESGSRPGGIATGDGGVTITTLDITVKTFGLAADGVTVSWDYRGDLIRAFLLLTPGQQQQGNQVVTGTITLS